MSRYKPMSAAQRARYRIRRHRTEMPGSGDREAHHAGQEPLRAGHDGGADTRRGETTWDSDAPIAGMTQDRHARARTGSAPRAASLGAQVLGLLADPSVRYLSPGFVQESLGYPMTDIQLALDALVSAGELREVPDAFERYDTDASRKQALESMFESAARDLGHPTALAVLAENEELALEEYGELDEPRLPVTAGLLSFFLPGTGQLLNGDVARASLVFAVWSLAMLANLSPIWVFVSLYAGAEAFFTAKIRTMERKLSREQRKAALPESKLERA